MSEPAASAPPPKPDYVPPAGSTKTLTTTLGGKPFTYEAEAGWITLRKDEKPLAEMFSVRYFVAGAANRPLTFVFNGGPGASSVYLHVGALGPRRVAFGDHGELLAPPHRLVDNDESWLPFTDLVFIDPIGTGFSRMIPDDKKDAEKKDGGTGDAAKDVEYWRLKRDLESLGEFMRTFLSKHHRWESPVWLAGESYGGFRVAKLAKMLPQDYGVALTGAILISPALEFTLLDGSDYDDLMWLDTFATMAGGAAWHGKCRKAKPGETGRQTMDRASVFALTELLPVLAGGDLAGEAKRLRVLEAAADWLGLPRAVVKAKNGRITIDWFVKNLLRDQGKTVGLYDATITVLDPFPDRDEFTGPDPTLHQGEPVFAAGINTQLRTAIGLETERDYALLSETVNEAWKIDTRVHALQSQVGATDDLRYGMSLNPHLKVRISHGLYDLVTPYFATERIARLLKLDPSRQAQLSLKHYGGGHMFYTWKQSRQDFTRDIEELFGK